MPTSHVPASEVPFGSMRDGMVATTRCCAGSFVLIAWLASGLYAEDWQQFRGPTGQGDSSATGIPVRWSRTDHVTWDRPIPGKAWSSPVVAQGRIYLTTAVAIGGEKVVSEAKFTKLVDNRYSLRALCLDQASGDTLWDVEVAQVPQRVSIHPKNSHASATPIVADGKLYVHYGPHGTAALDLDGKVLWQTKVDFKPVHGTGGSAVLYRDLMIFHCDGGREAFAIALDRSTGKERWRSKRSVEAKRSFSFATPLIIDHEGRTTLVSPASDAVYGLDPKTGDEYWNVRYPQRWSIVPRPVFSDGRILVCTGYEGPPELLAIRPGGSGDVTESHVVWRANRFVPHNPSPIVHQGHIFMVSDSGIASCRDLETGDLIWKQRMRGDYSASPFLAEGRLYFLSEDGVCTVIKASDEYEEISRNDVDERTLASMVPIDQGILLRTESSLLKIEP